MNNAIQGHELSLASQSGANLPEIVSALTGWVFLGGCVAMILTISTIHQILSSRKTSHRAFNGTPLRYSPSDPVHEAIKRISKKHRFVTVLRDSLPPGWEVGINVQGDIYYVDHNQQKTSWNHPVLSPMNIHKLLEPIVFSAEVSSIPTVPVPPPTPVSPVASIGLSITTAPALLQQQQGEAEPEESGCCSANSMGSNTSLDDTTPSTPSPEILPEGWEMAVTPMGIPYYINHSTRQTTWVDPRTCKPSVASTQSVFLLAQLHTKRQPPCNPNKGKRISKTKVSISAARMLPFSTDNPTSHTHGQTTGYSVHH